MKATTGAVIRLALIYCVITLAAVAREVPLIKKVNVQVSSPDLAVTYKCFGTHRKAWLQRERTQNGHTLKGYRGSCHSI